MQTRTKPQWNQAPNSGEDELRTSEEEFMKYQATIAQEQQILDEAVADQQDVENVPNVEPIPESNQEDQIPQVFIVYIVTWY